MKVKRRTGFICIILSIMMSFVYIGYSQTKTYTEYDLDISDEEGMTAYRTGDYKTMVKSFLKSAEICEQLYGVDNPKTSTRYNNIGEAYRGLEEYDKAIIYFNKALTIDLKIFGEYSIKVALRYSNLGMVYRNKREYDKAIKFYEKALEIYIKSSNGNNPKIVIKYNDLGEIYTAKREYDKAILYFRKALEIDLEVNGEIHPDVARDYTNIALAYDGKGEYDKAINSYMKSLEIDLKLLGDNDPKVARDYNNIGMAYAYKEEFDKAEHYLEKALKIQLKNPGEEHRDTAITYNNLGYVSAVKGDYDRAIRYYEKSLGIDLKVLGENHSDTATVYNNIGEAYVNKGDYNKAIGYFKTALDIDVKILDKYHPYLARDYNNLGVAYIEKEDYDKANIFLKNALDILIKTLGETHPSTATCYGNLGVTYSNKGDYDRAIIHYEKSLAIYREVFGDKHPSLATTYNNLGLVYSSKGDYDHAIEYYDKALEIFIKTLGDKHPSTAMCYNNLGLVYDQKKDHSRAGVYYEKSLLISKETIADQNTISISKNFGRTCIASEQYHQAYTSFLTGIETIEKVRRLNLSGGTDFTSRNINSYYYAVNACFFDKNMQNMFNISERMRAMGYIERLSLKGAIDASGIDPAQGKRLLKLKDDIERLSDQRQKLISADTFNMNDQQKKEHDKQLDSTSKQLAAAEDEFNKLDAGFMKNEKYKMLRDSSVVTVKTAQGMCGNDGVIIEYIIPEKSDDYMKPYAIIITGSSINAVELDSTYNYSVQIEKYRKAVKENNKTEIDKLGAEIYGKLIAPVESYINSAGIKKLIIVPDGSLAFLPFDSLKTKDSKYLSERYELNLTPSVTVSCMIKNRKYEKRDNLMAFGGGMYSSTGESKTRGQSSFRGIAIEENEKEKLASKAYNSPLEYYTAQQIGWSDLPGTEREVSAINEKIYRKKNTEVFTGQRVSEENLKSLSKSGKLKKYSSIHLACHGYYDPEYPEYSAVVFSEVSGKLKDSKDDGYMSVEETALLNLQSEIVVLSACETGLGRIVSGDGVIGLTRAFQVAGSNRVLVTLWPVSDEATEAFMVSFYAKVRAGMSYSRALVEVKEEFRRSGGSGASNGADYSAPYYWAGFVLYE